MSFLTDIWRQLVRRRLWPVALLLVAALVAVPMFLAQDPEPAVDTAAPAPAPAVNSELAEAPIVTAAADDTSKAGRKPLGKSHDIFKSTVKPPKAAKVTKVEPKAKDEADTPEPATETPASGGGGGTTTPATPVDPTPAPKPKTYPLNSLTVRFGSHGSMKQSNVTRDEALPSTSQPLLIFLGLSKDRGTASFLLAAGAVAQGDGECHPTPESCETIRLDAGETEFIDVVDATGAVTGQYQLDLLKIHAKAKRSAARSAGTTKLAKVSSLSGAPVASVAGIARTATRSR